MKKFSAFVLAGFAVFALNGCTGGATDDGTNNNGGQPTGDSIGLDELSGYAIVDYGGSSIHFCDGIAYVYDSNAEHYGTYSIGDDGYRVNFFPEDEYGSYRIDTEYGAFYVGSTYYVNDVGDSITVDAIESANCN